MKHTINAIGFAVKDMKVMVNFFRDVMGFNLEWDGGDFANARQKKVGSLICIKGRITVNC
jgi:hypothetical protein